VGYDLVERIDERGGVERAEDACERAGQPDLAEQRDPSSGVARNRPSVA
jgi:hypothetical protein